jgi:mono/diheme cytochrome c family protein
MAEGSMFSVMPHGRRVAFTAALVFSFAAIPLVSAQQTVEVVIQKYRFEPAEVQIRAGDTVKWINQEKRIYFERCAGCHGVLRKGATGKPLTPDITLGKGTDYLKVFIAYGSPAGMPNWHLGRDDEKTGGPDGALHPARRRPRRPSGAWPMKKTWKVIVPPEKRPTKKMNNYNIENIFSTTLRDTGEVALIDGDTKKIINIVKTGYAVHISRMSASGRYLFVIGATPRST